MRCPLLSMKMSELHVCVFLLNQALDDAGAAPVLLRAAVLVLDREFAAVISGVYHDVEDVADAVAAERAPDPTMGGQVAGGSAAV